MLLTKQAGSAGVKDSESEILLIYLQAEIIFLQLCFFRLLALVSTLLLLRLKGKFLQSHPRYKKQKQKLNQKGVLSRTVKACKKVLTIQLILQMHQKHDIHRNMSLMHYHSLSEL